MVIIDCHAHIFPSKIAAKASRAISDFYEVDSFSHTGTCEELLASGARIGVSRYVVHSTATKPEQVVSINDFIIEQTNKHPEFIGFGTLHPAFGGNEAELDRIAQAGLRGVKLHPDFQAFQIDAPEMDGIYRDLALRGLPVLVHAGDKRYDFSGPRRIAHVLDKHPDLVLIAAHMGGYTEWDEAAELLAGRPLWFDISSTLWKLPQAAALRLIERHGMDRILYGSDFPMWDHAEELARILSLGLSPADQELLFHRNAERLFGLR